MFWYEINTADWLESRFLYITMSLDSRIILLTPQVLVFSNLYVSLSFAARITNWWWICICSLFHHKTIIFLTTIMESWKSIFFFVLKIFISFWKSQYWLLLPKYKWYDYVSLAVKQQHIANFVNKWPNRVFCLYFYKIRRWRNVNMSILLYFF